ncbi:unnamed protein product [Amoebophrya sp. A25]|nr:unnamed protein product [Amoebophrya sp. A25]|eukprot:GSA25T00014845001.1
MLVCSESFVGALRQSMLIRIYNLTARCHFHSHNMPAHFIHKIEI